MKLQKAIAVIGAGVLLFAASDAITYAATGSSLVLGKINTANAATTIQNTGAAPALRLLTKSSATAPLIVNGKGKVTNLYADRAATADNASKVGGQTIAQVRAGINAATVGGQTAAQIASSHPRPAGVVWVAKSGGQFTSVSAALTSITDNGPANRYVIRVAPGTYAETRSVAMKDYVDVEGSGQGVTTITCACGSDTYPGADGNSSVFLVTGALHIGIRDLTIANTGSSLNYATGVETLSAEGGDITLDHLTVTAAGGIYGVGTGIVNYSSSSPTMTNMTVTATGGQTSWGVYNAYSSSPTMTDVTVLSTGFGSSSYGIYDYSSSPTMTNVTVTSTDYPTAGGNSWGIVNQSSSSPTMTNVTVTANGAGNGYGILNESSSPTMTNVTVAATASTNNFGIYNQMSSSPTMTGGSAIASGAIGTNNGIFTTSGAPKFNTVTATGTGGTQAHGISNTFGAAATLVNVTATGSGGSSNQDWGIDNSDSSTMTISDSFITGTPNSILNSGSTVDVAYTRLSSPASGTMTCIGTYDATTFAPLNASCL
jgi:hypothetical protein